MRLDLLGRFPLLLLLLALWGSVRPLCAWRQFLTRAKWFEIQHVRSSPVSCNTEMNGVNNYTQNCKVHNTFLHDSFENVSDTCLLSNVTCKNGMNNCHRSPQRVNMTDCTLTSGKYPKCKYKDTPLYKFFIIACDRPQQGDPPYQWVPVHLDKVI
ncbi:ribonuclease K6 [Felis catus]|uniref:Ribonuclease A-domain domain-containing protein n=1 Tax=Felis catus TaxID=9685 RepID=A0ABI7XX67_FELCA|nr:ribonuclease K6 [Felis catus]